MYGNTKYLAETILKNTSKAEGFTLPVFKPYFKAIVIKIVRNWHKDIQTNHCNRIEISEKDLHLYGQSIFNKDIKTIQQGIVFSSGGIGTAGYPLEKEEIEKTAYVIK